jgi:hypothetical protein
MLIVIAIQWPSIVGLDRLCSYQAHLFVGTSIAWNEEDRDIQELDEMQLVVDLLPTLMIEMKTVFLFGGGGGGGSSGGSREWSISRVHICHDASIQQGLVQLMAARKTKP